MEYEQKTYAQGFAVVVDPPERAADVMHYLITGHLLCNRPLDGVTWEKVESVEYNALLAKRAKDLMSSVKKMQRIS